jgi:hypothetical protein
MTAKDRYQALLSLGTVMDRLSAWRDNADLMLKRCPPTEEDRWQNEKDNYSYLLTCLEVTQRIVKAE